MSQTSDPSSPSRRSESTSLHALAAIARRMGLDTSHAELRRNYALPNQEPDTRLIVAIARDLGLTGKSLKLKFKDLKSIRKSLPAMLRVSDGVALILEAVREHPTSGLIAVVRDPTGGDDVTTVVDEAKLSAIWRGEVILFKRKHGITDEEQPFSLRWVLGLALNQKKLLVDLSLGAFVSIIFALVPIIAIKVVMDRVIPNHSLSTLEVLVGGFSLLVLLETVMFAIRQKLTEVVTARIDSRMNLYVFEKILKLPLAYFETHPAGLTMSKIGRLWQLRSFVVGKLFGTYLDAIPLLGLVPLLFYLNSQLATYVCVIALVVFFVVMAFLKPIALRHAEVVRAEQIRHTHLVESIHGMRTIKALTLEGRRRREWDEHTAVTTLAKYKLGITASYPQTFTIPLERLMFTGGLCLGAFLVLTSPTPDTAGGLAAFVILSGRIGQPLVKLAQLQLELAEARGSIGELATIMNMPGEEERVGSGMRQPIQGAIAFQQVRFRYSAGSPYALDGVSFSVPAGTVLGVMGRSGSGKTTITRLLQRLSTSYDGMIKVDGMDLREINLQHLRTNIGIVLQENFLFSGTIRENISIAKPDASLAEIVRVAQLAGAEEFIERMTRGYDTWINEGASNLSGGQKQRLAIARALLTDPPVLLLDEATSALDAESEAIINANLKRIAKGRTVISISHRLSTLIDSDAILVMERGALYDMGTHDELLERCDIYQQLWHQQNRHIERASTRNKPVAAIGQDSAA